MHSRLVVVMEVLSYNLRDHLVNVVVLHSGLNNPVYVQVEAPKAPRRWMREVGLRAWGERCELSKWSLEQSLSLLRFVQFTEQKMSSGDNV